MSRGAKPGNHNARRHGQYSSTASTSAAAQVEAPAGATDSVAPIPSLADLILELQSQQQGLKLYIGSLPIGSTDPDTVKAYIAACNLYSSNLARQARMVKALIPIGGEKAQRLAEAMNEALGVLSEEFGIVL